MKAQTQTQWRVKRGRERGLQLINVRSTRLQVANWHVGVAVYDMYLWCNGMEASQPFTHNACMHGAYGSLGLSAPVGACAAPKRALQ